MKKVLLILGFITICLATNVIYARQVNDSQPVCYPDNCPQTSRNMQENCEIECLVEDCPRLQNDTQNNQVEYHKNRCRSQETNVNHHRNSRHHQ